MAYKVLDSTSTTQTFSTSLDPSSLLVGSTTLADPSSGQKAQVAQFHNADNQNPGGTAYGILTGGVAQLLNQAGNLDRQREVGIDGAAALGISQGGMSEAMQFKTSSASNISAGTASITPAAMAGTIGGVPWSIQIGSVLTVDTGANAEIVVVTNVSATTLTAVFGKAHNGSSTAFLVTGFVYNQGRDAAGEVDGATGIGTSVAAEYEYNGGAPGGGNFDRARSVQAKGIATATISSGGTQGSLALTLSAAAPLLKAGMQVQLRKASTFPAVGSFETVYVDLSYIEAGTSVPLRSAIVASVPYDTVAFDAFATNGPGLSGFTPIGVGIEEEALYDPVSGLYYIERAATQDAAPPQNIVMESVALWNGTSMDRWRSAGTGIGRVQAEEGQLSTLNISASTLVKAAAGRSFKVSVLTAGSTSGTLNDIGSTGGAGAANQVATIPNIVGVYDINWPHLVGIVLVPGTGQVLSISYT